jgi:hypothetical protein
MPTVRHIPQGRAARAAHTGKCTNTVERAIHRRQDLVDRDAAVERRSIAGNARVDRRMPESDAHQRQDLIDGGPPSPRSPSYTK